MRARRLRIFIISEGSAECVGGWAEEAATRRATETPRTNELIEHDVGGGNEIGIATHVINAPRQVARVEARDLRNRAAGIATERHAQVARSIKARARAVHMLWIDPPLHGPCG